MTDTPNTLETTMHKFEPYATGKGMYVWHEGEIVLTLTLQEMKEVAGWMESLIQAAERGE